MTDLGVGTSAYRDPFLRQRGRWDLAADRWSAAVTLHEMLTGVRPGLPDGVLAIDPKAEVEISAERFDSSVRDRLLSFFKQALARDVEHRFESAKAMRRAWERCFTAPSVRPGPQKKSRRKRCRTESQAPRRPPSPTPTIAAIARETPVEALPLSTRARNALDRAGLMTAQDLLSLPDNRLSAVRGVGSLVAREVLDFRDRWRTLRAARHRRVRALLPRLSGRRSTWSPASVSKPSAAIALQDAGSSDSDGARCRARQPSGRPEHEAWL